MIRFSMNDTCCKNWSAYTRTWEKISRGSWFWIDECVAAYSLANMEVLFGSSLVVDHVASPRYTDAWIAGILVNTHSLEMDVLHPTFLGWIFLIHTLATSLQATCCIVRKASRNHCSNLSRSRTSI